MLLLGVAAIAFWAWGLPGKSPGEKSPMQMQMDAVQSAKAIQRMNEVHDAEIEAALKD